MLTGLTNSSFNTSTLGDQYTGFSTFIKNDSSTWTLSNSYDTSSNGITHTQLNQGIINAGINPLTFSAGHTLTYTLNGPHDTSSKLITMGLVTLGAT